MKEIKDYKGARFGKLTVIGEGFRQNKRVYYPCQCDCGTIKNIRRDHLEKGETVSCGCLQREKAAKNLTQDITGQTFGFLMAIKPLYKNSHRETVWECKCLNCGNFTKASIGKLHDTRRVPHCGCKSKSYGENKIEITLQNLGVKFETQYSFEGLKFKGKLRFDFAIFDDNNKLICLIEYQGIQHFENWYLDNKDEN